jgi:hypothetical protein
MSTEIKTCPYCGGSGKRILQQKELIVNGRPLSNEVAIPCICSLNKYVSSKYDRLSGVGDVSGKDAIQVAKKLPFTDAVVHGPEELFLYVVKCFIVIHFPFNRRFAVLTGADIAEKYAMAQPNGVIPTVDLLTTHDLMAILCVARVNNRAIGPGTQEVLANRFRSRKPTWVYAPGSTALLESKEFAPDEGRGSAASLVEGWPVWQLSELFPNLEGLDRSNVKVSMSRSKTIAADL